MISALVGFLLVSVAQAQAPETTTMKLGTESVVLRFPSASTQLLSTENVMRWSGWSGLALQHPHWPQPFLAAGDWTSISEKFGKVKANPEAVVWKTKFVILADLDTLDAGPNGLLFARRNSLDGPRFAETFASIAQFIASASALTNGAVKIEPDVYVEADPCRDEASLAKPDYSAEYLTHYLEPRINGGTYEAEDKIYRGPYASIFVITPTNRNSGLELDPTARYSAKPFFVNGIPTAEVPFIATGGIAMPGAFTRALLDTWFQLVNIRMTGLALPTLKPNLQGANWKDAASLVEPSTAELLKRYASNPSTDTGTMIALPTELFQPAFHTQNVHLSLESDPVKGQVLSYIEDPTTRFGGFSLPAGDAPIDPQVTPTLTFSLKQTTNDPFALTFTSVEGKTITVVIGRDLPAPAGENFPVFSAVPYNFDGAWHSVVIDLNELKIGKLSSFRFGSSPNAAFSSRRHLEPVECELADFKLGTEPATAFLPAPTADASSSDSESRSLAAVSFGKTGAPSPELLTLLKDSDETVVLNAANAYRNVVDPLAEPRLVELTFSVNSRIAEAAIKALIHQGTPTAMAAVVHSMKSGLEYAREIAARSLAEKGIDKIQNDIVVLLAAKHWHTRLAGVEALAKVPGDASGMMRMAFLEQEEPAIKLAVVQNSDSNREFDLKRLLWCAVNEPSDLVRAWSNIKLARSNLVAYRTEGLKGVRDESALTRLVVVQALGESPNPAYVPALKLALTDSDARVRAASVMSLSHQAGVTLDDFKQVLRDQHPLVQEELLIVAKQKNLPLPAETLELMQKCPVKSVSTSAKNLG